MNKHVGSTCYHSPAFQASSRRHIVIHLNLIWKNYYNIHLMLIYELKTRTVNIAFNGDIQF